jgi:hypothetical protein
MTCRSAAQSSADPTATVWSRSGRGFSDLEGACTCTELEAALDGTRSECDAAAAFREAAGSGANLIPLSQRILSDHLTPVLAYRCLVREDQRSAPSFLFESVVNGDQQVSVQADCWIAVAIPDVETHVHGVVLGSSADVRRQALLLWQGANRRGTCCRGGTALWVRSPAWRSWRRAPTS